MSILTDPHQTDDRSELDHASRAADHLLRPRRRSRPAVPATAELHDATAALVLALAAALAAGGAR